MEQQNKIKITVAFLTTTDPNNKRSFSGTHYYMLHTLKKIFHEVVPLGPVKLSNSIKWIEYLKVILTFARGKRYNRNHSELRAKFYSKIFQKQLNDKKIDLIIAAAASPSISYLNTDIPIIHVTDATFQLMVGYYEAFSNLSKSSVIESDKIELRSIKNSTLSIYSSGWAAKSAINYYGKEKDKVFQIPYGVNTNKIPDRELIYLKASNKTCKLLFLGVNWKRKGGDIAFATLMELLQMPLATELTICGCRPPKNVKNKQLHVIPYLDKNFESDHDAFSKLMLDTNFIILPTRADCTPMAFPEAAAYGIPVITTYTGGVPDIIENNVNGFCLPYQATPKEYCDIIFAIFSDKTRYNSLITSSRNKYEEQLNWNAWGKRIKQLYETEIKSCEDPDELVQMPNVFLSFESKMSLE